MMLDISRIVVYQMLLLAHADFRLDPDEMRVAVALVHYRKEEAVRTGYAPMSGYNEKVYADLFGGLNLSGIDATRARTIAGYDAATGCTRHSLLRMDWLAGQRQAESNDGLK